MSDALKCGHPAKYLYRHPSVGSGCIACHQTPIAIRRYASDLCGIVVTESDPIEFAKAIVDDPGSPLMRLAFADWLDEQDDLRGELIRVESELVEILFLPCFRCDETGKLENKLLPRGWQYCPHCGGTGRRDRAVADTVDIKKTINQVALLQSRRVELRQQLGYGDHNLPEADLNEVPSELGYMEPSS